MVQLWHILALGQEKNHIAGVVVDDAVCDLQVRVRGLDSAAGCAGDDQAVEDDCSGDIIGRDHITVDPIAAKISLIVLIIPVAAVRLIADKSAVQRHAVRYGKGVIIVVVRHVGSLGDPYLVAVALGCAIQGRLQIGSVGNKLPSLQG